jgi:hypothetical protein
MRPCDAATNLLSQCGDFFRLDEPVTGQQLGAVDSEIGRGNAQVVRSDQSSLVQLVVIRGPRQFHRRPDFFSAEGTPGQVREHRGEFFTAIVGIHREQDNPDFRLSDPKRLNT